MSAEPPDERVAYGNDPNRFLEAHLPRTKGPHSVLLSIHGGYWRAKETICADRGGSAGLIALQTAMRNLVPRLLRLCFGRSLWLLLLLLLWVLGPRRNHSDGTCIGDRLA